MKSTRRNMLVLSLALFAASLLLPAAQSKDQSFQGLYFLLAGPLGFLVGEFRWVANIFLLISWVASSSPKAPSAWGVTCAVVALAIGASCAVLPPSVVVGAGTYTTEKTQLALGGFLWIAAQAMALIANLLRPTSQGDHDAPAA